MLSNKIVEICIKKKYKTWKIYADKPFCLNSKIYKVNLKVWFKKLSTTIEHAFFVALLLIRI